MQLSDTIVAGVMTFVGGGAVKDWGSIVLKEGFGMLRDHLNRRAERKKDAALEKPQARRGSRRKRQRGKLRARKRKRL